jgi:hypothetical protein
MSNPKFRKHAKVQTDFSGDSRKDVISAGEQSPASPIEHGVDS